MRWPSVYFWGWLMLPGRFILFFGALAFAAFAAQFLPSKNAFEWALIPTFLGLVAVSLMLTACPRCGRNVYQRSGWFSNNLWPVSKCSRCGLDLKQFSPFDKRAKSHS